MRRIRGIYWLAGLLVVGLVLVGSLVVYNLPDQHAGAAPTPSAESRTAHPTPTPPPSVLLAAYPTPKPPPPLIHAANGYTVTLYPVSADANRIVMTYTVDGPPGISTAATWLGTGWNDQWLFTGPDLKEENTNAILPSVSSLPGSIIPGHTGNNLGKDYVHIMAFDTNGLKKLPSVLHLHMTAKLWVNKELKEVSTVWSVPQADILIPDLTFDFTMPSYPIHRLAELKQTVIAGKTELTLETVSLTTSEARFVFSAARSKSNSSWQPDNIHLTKMELQVGGWHEAISVSDTYPREGVGTELALYGWTTHYPVNLLDKQGEWTLIVKEIIWGAYDSWNNDEGPWVFHFTMPPLTLAQP